MKKVIPLCASLVLLLAVSGGAKAAVLNNFSFIVPDTFNDSSSPPGCGATPCSLAFADQWLFDVDIASRLAELNNILNFAGFIDLTTFTVALWTEDPAFPLSGIKDPALGGVPLAAGIQGTGGASNQWTMSFSPLASGVQYFIEVAGDVTSTTTGSYTIQIAATNLVPLPPAAVLFLSALAGFAGFSRIRRRKAVAT